MGGVVALILVIDDSPLMRDLVRRMLEGAGHEVVLAEDGKAGLHVLETQAVQLVVTDIYMPGDDGITTVRRVRKGWPHLPVITMSGGSEAGDMSAAALALGARSALRKPFMSAELLDAVRTALEERGTSK